MRHRQLQFDASVACGRDLRDGRLDLFVAHYLVFDPDKIPIRGKDPMCVRNGVPVFCGPNGVPQERHRLYHNNGDGTFTDVSEKAGILGVKPNYALTATAADFDGDGWPDIYVACDTAPSLFYRNNHDGTFSEVAVPAGCAFDEHGVALAGMGAGVGDYDGDGWLDIVRTNFSEQVPTLYRNYGAGFEVTIAGSLRSNTAPCEPPPHSSPAR